MDTSAEHAASGPSGLLRALVVRFASSEEHYVRLLGGPPDTVTMRAGLVTLKIDESVGEHTTAENEEAIVVLRGVGELRLEGRPALRLAEGSIAYCPPETHHNVVNTGAEVLRYVYIVSKARSNHERR